MACDALIWGLLFVGCSIQALWAISEDDPLEYMNKEEREALKEEARDMFYHAYNAYMDNAYPADELMPLSCKGRYRGSEPNRGDIDSTLGNFSLTLVDTLDTLMVLGDLEEFENAVKLVARDVSFDTDIIVSLFETNIRMLGGLLSGHILAEYLQQRADIMPWYRGELLDLAKDLGYRFLPAFNTTTGIPYGRSNTSMAQATMHWYYARDPSRFPAEPKSYFHVLVSSLDDLASHESILVHRITSKSLPFGIGVKSRTCMPV